MLSRRFHQCSVPIMHTVLCLMTSFKKCFQKWFDRMINALIMQQLAHKLNQIMTLKQRACIIQIIVYEKVSYLNCKIFLCKWPLLFFYQQQDIIKIKILRLCYTALLFELMHNGSLCLTSKD